MTGTNCTLDAVRNGPERQRQLLRKGRLADENLFLPLTAHANGRPLMAAMMRRTRSATWWRPKRGRLRSGSCGGFDDLRRFVAHQSVDDV